MTRKSRFYSKTNDIVVFFFWKKCSNFLWYKCRKWHLKDDSTVLSEDLNMNVTWALWRMKQAFVMKRGISPGNMPQVFSWGRYQSILNPAVLRLWKVGYCSMIEGYGTDFATVYTVLKHAQMVGDVWNRRMQNHVWCGHLHPSKTKSNEVTEVFSNTVDPPGGLHIALKYYLCWVRSFVFMYRIKEIFQSTL